MVQAVSRTLAPGSIGVFRGAGDVLRGVDGAFQDVKNALRVVNDAFGRLAEARRRAGEAKGASGPCFHAIEQRPQPEGLTHLKSPLGYALQLQLFGLLAQQETAKAP